MKFTKEEISLCKQVAEKHRKSIIEGEHIQQNYGKPEIILLTLDYIHHHLPYIDEKHWFPLWTISDCLEFLEKEGYGRIIGFIHFDNGCWAFTTENIITSNNYKKARGEKANTKLEACLKAVLAVLEKGK